MHLNLLTLNRYQYLSKLRSYGKGGGLVVIYRNFISITKVGFSVLGVYGSEKLCELLTLACAALSQVILLGDFIIYVDTVCSTSTQIKSFLDCFHLTQNVNFPTHTYGHTLDLVCTSAWQTPNDFMHLNLLTLNRYQHLSKLCSYGKGGGLVVIYRNFISITQLDFQSLEFMALKVGSNCPLIIVLIYIPSKQPSYFFSELCELLTLACAALSQVILLGDFNIHIDTVCSTSTWSWGTRTRTQVRSRVQFLGDSDLSRTRTHFYSDLTRTQAFRTRKISRVRPSPETVHGNVTDSMHYHESLVQ
ncbi:Phosphoglycerate kinase [Labeo rohita]|uniref:Phosphoglycerate kinase n=1 Tax=Labeo rohita TaxID=84645 RepID=A0ABQ8L7R3_LABRO|nr:Phosphoglycerate kinase [Labeo rohita]